LVDNLAADALKTAAAGLPAVGIPIAAVYFSGSVVGFSAAGITSGLAALGVGSMLPGIGVAILLGTGVFVGLSKALDIGGKRAKERARAERDRRVELVIRNMQQTIKSLMCRMQELLAAAADAEVNREAIRVLNERMMALKQLIERRKFELGDA
jgi:hypothetical protein